MFTPLPEMYLSTGISSSTEIFSTPPGILDFHNSVPVFIRENEKVIKGKKKIVFCDNFLHVLIDKLYNGGYTEINVHPDIDTILSKLKLNNYIECVPLISLDSPLSMSPESESLLSEQEIKTLLYYSKKFITMVDSLLEQEFEIFFHLNSAIVQLKPEYLQFLNGFLLGAKYTSNSEVYKMFAEFDNTPADNIYIIDLPKITQLISDNKEPCLCATMVHVIGILYSTQFLDNNNYFSNIITTVLISDEIDKVCNAKYYSRPGSEIKTMEYSGNEFQLLHEFENRAELKKEIKHLQICNGEYDCDSIFDIVEKVPNLLILTFKCDSIFDNSDANRYFSCKLQVIDISNSSDGITFEPGANLQNVHEDCISVVTPGLPCLELVIDRSKVYAASTMRHNLGTLREIVLSATNVDSINLIEILNNELHARSITVHLIDAELLLVILNKVDVRFRTNIRQLFLECALNFSSGDIIQIINSLPNLTYLVIDDENLPDDEYETEELLELVQAKNIRFIANKNTSKNMLSADNVMQYNSDAGHDKNIENVNNYSINMDNTPHTLRDKKTFYANCLEDDPSTTSYRIDILSPTICPDAVLEEHSHAFPLQSVSREINQCEIPDRCTINLAMKYRQILTKNQYFGSHKLQMSNVWKPLPSLDSQERLQSISVLDAKKNPVNFLLGYCKNSNLYYVKLAHDETSCEVEYAKPRSVMINFVLVLESKPEYLPDHGKITKAIQYACSFNLDNMTTVKASVFYGKPLIKFLGALWNNRAGACLERSISFANYLLSRKLILANDIRLVSNDTHIYCEIKAKNKWCKIELGGSPANIISHDAEENITPPLLTFNAANKALPKSTLIQLAAENIEGYALGLLEYYTKNNTMVCYIHSMKDLLGSNNNEFKEFIQNSKHSQCQTILILNLQNFSAEEIVRANSILDDKQPNMNGLEIPNSVRIVGLHDSNYSQSNSDSSFYSRFIHINSQDTNIQPYESPISNLSYTTCDEIPDHIKCNSELIDCYETVYWHSYAFGGWEMQNDQLILQESSLLQRLPVKSSGYSVKKIKQESEINIIINNPSLSEEFRLFWNKACITKRISAHKKRYTGFNSIYLSRLNNMELSNQHIEWDPSGIIADKFYYILNGTTYEEFFRLYSFMDGKLCINPGHIKNNTNGILAIHLTHNITWQKWARLLDECKKYSVTLRIVPSFDLLLPDGFKACPVSAQVASDSAHKYCIFPTEEIFTANAIAFNVSEDSVEKLVANVEYTTQNNRYNFNLIESDIIDKLSNSQDILLYGHLSQSFAEKFASMLNGSKPYLVINGAVKIFSGRLYCMPNLDSISNFNFAPKLNINDCSIVNIMHSNQTDNIDFLDEIDNPHDQMLIRANNLMRVLNENPIAYITGKTGIGKSTFINNQLKKHVNCMVFNETDQIMQWAECKQPNTYIILFVDEANMTGCDFNIFDSMFLDNNSILYNGKILNLTAKHKIVLAGNACNYSGDRKLPDVVKRHPYIEVPFAALKRNTIGNIITDTLSSLGIPQQRHAAIIDTFANIYENISKIDEEHVYITAREIKLALYLLKAKYDNTFVSTMIFINALPEKHRQQAREIMRINSEVACNAMNHMIIDKKIAFSDLDYLITESRKFSLIGIHSILQLRVDALKSHFSMPMAGIILEGAPATGKSDLIRFILNSQGYSKVASPNTTFETSSQVDMYFASLKAADTQYINCYASSSLAVRKAILINAYRQGIIVVFDEFNSAIKGLERLLNDLLMHQYQGGKAEKPGFMLIGAQNHISLAGRSSMSEALRRRLICIDVPTYPKQELVQILQHKHFHVESNHISTAVEKFISKPITFIYPGLSVQRTLRDLEREVLILGNKFERVVSPEDVIMTMNDVDLTGQNIATHRF